MRTYVKYRDRKRGVPKRAVLDVNPYQSFHDICVDVASSLQIRPKTFVQVSNGRNVRGGFIFNGWDFIGSPIGRIQF